MFRVIKEKVALDLKILQDPSATWDHLDKTVFLENQRPMVHQKPSVLKNLQEVQMNKVCLVPLDHQVLRMNLLLEHITENPVQPETLTLLETVN